MKRIVSHEDYRKHCRKCKKPPIPENCIPCMDKIDEELNKGDVEQ